VIGPAGFVSFTQSQFGFTLNGAGETLYFIKPDNSRVLDAVNLARRPTAYPTAAGRTARMTFTRSPPTHRELITARLSSVTSLLTN